MTREQKTLLLDKMSKSGFRTYAQLADKMSMSPTALSHRLNGKTEWNATEIKQIMNLLKLSATDASFIFLR